MSKYRLKTRRQQLCFCTWFLRIFKSPNVCLYIDCTDLKEGICSHTILATTYAVLTSCFVCGRLEPFHMPSLLIKLQLLAQCNRLVDRINCLIKVSIYFSLAVVEALPPADKSVTKSSTAYDSLFSCALADVCIRLDTSIRGVVIGFEFANRQSKLTVPNYV